MIHDVPQAEPRIGEAVPFGDLAAAIVRRAIINCADPVERAARIRLARDCGFEFGDIA